MNFRLFFEALGKVDSPRTIPKLFSKPSSSATAIPYTITTDLESFRKLPDDPYRTKEIEDMVLDLLKKTKDYFDNPPFARGFRHVQPMTWSDAGMGVPDRLEWDSLYVRTGDHSKLWEERSAAMENKAQYWRPAKL